MRLIALLLLQAFVRCSGGEAVERDKEACVDGAEGVCSAGAGVLPEAAEGQQEETAFLQERSSRTEPRRASGSRERLSVPSAQFPGYPTVSYLRAMGGINETVDQIHKAVELVNSTIVSLVGELQQHSGSFKNALNLAKSGAEATKFILGDEAVKSVEKLVDKLAALSESCIATANKTAGEAQDEMEKLLGEFEAKEDELMEKITDLEKQVQGIAGKNASLVLAEQRGPFGWLKRIFGFGGNKAKSPCEKAKESLATADSSVSEFEGLLNKFNMTVSGGFLDDVVGKLKDGLEKFQSAIQGAMQGVADSLPGTVQSALSKATDLFDKVAGAMKEKLAPAEKSIAKFLEEAKTPLLKVRTLLDTSGTKLEGKCD